MAPHCSTLAWKILWMEEPGRLQSVGSRGVSQGWATSCSLFTFMHWRRKWQPTPLFLPGESQGRGAWWAAVYGVSQSRTRCGESKWNHFFRKKKKNIKKNFKSNYFCQMYLVTLERSSLGMYSNQEIVWLWSLVILII